MNDKIDSIDVFINTPLYNPNNEDYVAVSNGIEKDVIKMVPNAISAPQIGGGHFFQWTRSKQLSKLLIDFINE